MKIVMIGAKAIPYSAGIDQYIENVGARLAAKGHHVIVFVRPHFANHREKTWRGIELVGLPSIRTKHLDAITHIAISVMRAVKIRPDIIHFHMIGASPFCLIPRMFGLKTVLHVHGLDYERAKWGVLAKAYLKVGAFLSAILPDRTIVISEGLQRFYKEKFNRETIFIPPGLDMPQIQEADEILKFGLKKDDYILFLSRLVPEKGCHYLIEAFKRVDTPMKLVIAGSSTYDQNYVERLKKSADPRIRFLGEVPIKTLKELYSNAYLFVQPSEIEGFPRTVQEALSYGRCVLASDIEGNREALGECGYTFKSKDIEDMASKIVFLIGRPDLVKSEFEKARKRIAMHYDWGNVIDRLEEAYNSLKGA